MRVRVACIHMHSDKSVAAGNALGCRPLHAAVVQWSRGCVHAEGSGRAPACAAWRLRTTHEYAEVRLAEEQLVVALKRQLERDAQRLHLRARGTSRQGHSTHCTAKGARPGVLTDPCVRGGSGTQRRPTLQLMTDREPASEQMLMYTNMLVGPCCGAT